jgi:hypothetical protein
MNNDNSLARFRGASIQHLLVPDTKVTRCGKDATLAHRYPALTRANSADRRPFRICGACERNA